MQYSLVERNLEKEHVPAALQWGLGIIPWSPLAGGFLTGKYREGQPAPSGARMAVNERRLAMVSNERSWRILAAVDEVAQETGATVAQVSLAWLLHKPGVASVIFGARSLAQLEDNLPAAELALSPDQLARLDRASEWSMHYPYDFMHRVQGRW